MDIYGLFNELNDFVLKYYFIYLDLSTFNKAIAAVAGLMLAAYIAVIDKVEYVSGDTQEEEEANYRTGLFAHRLLVLVAFLVGNVLTILAIHFI